MTASVILYEDNPVLTVARHAHSQFDRGWFMRFRVAPGDGSYATPIELSDLSLAHLKQFRDALQAAIAEAEHPPEDAP